MEVRSGKVVSFSPSSEWLRNLNENKSAYLDVENYTPIGDCKLGIIVSDYINKKYLNGEFKVAYRGMNTNIELYKDNFCKKIRMKVEQY